MIMIKIHKAWLKTKTELKKSFAVEFCITNHTHLIHVCIVDFKLYAYIDLIFKMHIKLSVVISHKENNTMGMFFVYSYFLIRIKINT